MVRRDAYRASGGHAAIRETMHDGLLLPQLFRRHGFATDLADLTALARCRMYRNAVQVWRGLEKNATEGMAAPARIVPFSALLLLGQVLPLPLFLLAPSALTGAALVASYVPRLIAAARFRQNLLGALLHPAGGCDPAGPAVVRTGAQAHRRPGYVEAAGLRPRINFSSRESDLLRHGR